VLTREELAATDVADHALEALAESEIEEIVVLGRRGPGQAAFTNPELRELGELRDADVIVEPGAVAEIAQPEDTTARRNVEILRDYAHRGPAGKQKRIVLRFLASPVEIVGDRHVEGVRVVHNELDQTLRARPTDRSEVIEAGLVLRSIGYRGSPIDGVPFDERAATVANEGGRVSPGVYAAGWIKRGPSGVIGTNKKCANETVRALLDDAAHGRLPAPPAGADALAELLRDRVPDRVEYGGWQRIDARERDRGAAQNRPRVKLVRRDELLSAAHAA
jgi:ferredoxin--NADP+ reductase